MIIQNRHDAPLPKRRNDRLKDAPRRRITHERVLLRDLSVYTVQIIDADVCGLGGGHEGVGDLDVRVQCVVDRVRQAHAVEALLRDEVGDVVDRLLVQALGQVRFLVARPVDAPQLHALAVRVDDPAGGGGEGQFLRGYEGGGEHDGAEDREEREEPHDEVGRDL